MPESPLVAAGAQVQPVSAAPLHVNRMFTGLWTQRSLLRDAATAYLLEKFYAATRFDALVGGANTEITPRMTLRRRPGFSMYNAAVGADIRRFYLFRAIVMNPGPTTQNRVLGDGPDGVYDITGPSTFIEVFPKTSGAGKTSFVSVGNVCYMSDGIDQKKFIIPAKSWQANTIYNTGDTILDTNNNLQVVEQLLSANISSIQVVRKLTTPPSGYSYAVMVTFTSNVSWPTGSMLTFAGLSNFTQLNGQTLGIYSSEIWGSGGPNTTIVAPPPGTSYPYGPTADTGTATSATGYAPGESGATQPAWPAGGSTATTTDGGIVWRSFGAPIFRWGAGGPVNPPRISANPLVRMWTPNTLVPEWYAIADTNNDIQVALTASNLNGSTMPKWNTATPSGTAAGAVTIDGNVAWQNCGQPQIWDAKTIYYSFQSIIDSNGNLQIVTNGGGGTSATTQPTWATGVGATTADSTLTWTCVGPGTALLTDTVEYAYSWHYVSGQVTTASPIATLNQNGAVLGKAGSVFADLSGPTNWDPDMDQIWIWRTAQGGSLLLLLAQIPNPNIGSAGTWYFQDNLPDSSLNAQIPAPINSINNPPPAYFIPLGFHYGRVIGYVGSILYYSSGPDTITGNGNESFAPLNKFQLPSGIVAGWSTAIGFIVFRVDGISILLGKGEDSDPFFVANIFDAVGLASADAWTTRGNTVSLMTKTGKLVALSTSQIVAAIEGQLSQALDDSEVGFPIGDLLTQFTPANSFVVWHEGPSNDSRLWVADGSSRWYNMLILTQPEQAQPWSPQGNIISGLSAIASIETAPGVQSLLLATNSGPIFKRDLSVNTDNGTTYAANASGGSIVLAQPGSTAGLQFITTEEALLTGATPVSVAVLLDEIQGSFTTLRNVTNDPPNLPPSKSVLARRSWASQGPDTVQPCRHMQWQMSWPAENFANELLTYTIYGRLPEKARK